MRCFAKAEKIQGQTGAFLLCVFFFLFVWIMFFFLLLPFASGFFFLNRILIELTPAVECLGDVKKYSKQFWFPQEKSLWQYQMDTKKSYSQWLISIKCLTKDTELCVKTLFFYSFFWCFSPHWKLTATTTATMLILSIERDIKLNNCNEFIKILKIFLFNLRLDSVFCQRVHLYFSVRSFFLLIRMSFSHFLMSWWTAKDSFVLSAPICSQRSLCEEQMNKWRSEHQRLRVQTISTSALKEQQ